MYREGTGYGAEGVGASWSVIMGKMKMLTVGSSVGPSFFFNRAPKNRGAWRGRRPLVCCIAGLGRETVGKNIVSLSGQAVWGVNAADEVFVRTGLSEQDTKGKEWTKVDGSMKMIRWGQSSQSHPPDAASVPLGSAGRWTRLTPSGAGWGRRAQARSGPSGSRSPAASASSRLARPASGVSRPRTR
jgi:hypothetical protein